MGDLAEAALAYAAAGLAVFPVLPGQKAPATRRGLHAASTDPQRVARWWGRHPRFNIGLSVGACGLVALDCDRVADWPPEHGPRPEGVETGADVLANEAGRTGVDCGWLVAGDVWQSATPSGGAHYLFTARGDGRASGNRAKALPGLDVRGRGGYIVAPPSRTPAGAYTAVNAWAAPPPVLPDWVADLLDPRPDPFDALRRALLAEPVRSSSRYVEAALHGEADAVRRAPEGTRNDTLVRASARLGQLVGAGILSDHHAATALTEAALSAGLGETEVAATVRSGLGFGRQHPRGMVP